MTETAREVFERLLAENPQFVKAPKTGQASAALPRHRTTSDWHLQQLSPREKAKHSARVEDFSGFQIEETAAVVGRHKSSIEGFCGRQFDPASPFSIFGEERPFSAFRADRGFAAARR